MEFVINVEEYMESWKDRICLECWGGHIPSEEELVNRGVLWQELSKRVDSHMRVGHFQDKADLEEGAQSG